MDADFSIELGADDPVLDFPWTDSSGNLAYFDLKRHPDLIARVEEAEKFPELAEFLRTVNSARSLVESAKCDAWTTAELSAEEEVFDAPCKFASYVDLVLTDENRVLADENRVTKSNRRLDFPAHENFAKRLIELLRRAPEMAASVEVCVRRCFFGQGENDGRENDERNSEPLAGFYFTLYVNGYGNDEATARKMWSIGLKLTENGIMQLSAKGPTFFG
jgi:hypothetical protein